MQKVIFKTATLLLFLFQGFTPAEGQDLFRYEDQNSAAVSQRQSDHLTSIKNRPTSIEVHLVRIENVASLLSQQSLSLNMPTATYETYLEYFDRPEESVFTWAGSIGDREGSVQLTVTGTDVGGMIHLENTIYELEPLGQGLHVWRKLDIS